MTLILLWINCNWNLSFHSRESLIEFIRVLELEIRNVRAETEKSSETLKCSITILTLHLRAHRTRSCVWKAATVSWRNFWAMPSGISPKVKRNKWEDCWIFKWTESVYEYIKHGLKVNVNDISSALTLVVRAVEFIPHLIDSIKIKASTVHWIIDRADFPDR